MTLRALSLFLPVSSKLLLPLPANQLHCCLAWGFQVFRLASLLVYTLQLAGMQVTLACVLAFPLKFLGSITPILLCFLVA